MHFLPMNNIFFNLDSCTSFSDFNAKDRGAEMREIEKMSRIDVSIFFLNIWGGEIL